MPMKIAYHGAGFVGFTGALHFARNGFEVVLFDPHLGRMNLIREGREPVHNIGKALDFDYWQVLKERVQLTTEFKDTLTADAHVLAIPTEQDGEPYFQILMDSVKRIAEESKGKPIVVESTIYPSCARDLQARYAGTTFVIAPRRDWFNAPELNVRECERVVGVDSSIARAIAEKTVGQVSRHIHYTSCENAEMVKELENATLYNMLAFNMDFARTYPDRDAAEIIRLASTHWRLPTLKLSLGIGGYCVPLGMKYLSRSVKDRTDRPLFRSTPTTS